MKTASIITMILVSSIMIGCSTTGNFIVPDGSKLYINNSPEPVKIEANGDVTTKPFFWSATSGIPYRLEQDGKTIKEGKLQSNFRVVSIFWPPFAIIYWPMGFNSKITFDLTKDPQ